MHQGKAAPKLALSFATRRIRLGLAHHGSPSAWTAPTKDHAVVERGKPAKNKRR